MPEKLPDYMREKAVQMRVDRQMSIDEIAERLALTVAVYDTYFRSRMQAWMDLLCAEWT